MAKSIAVITIVDDEGELTVDAVYDAETYSGQVCKTIMDGVAIAQRIADQELAKEAEDAV